MPEVWLTETDSTNRLLALKATRDAMRILAGDNKPTGAEAVRVLETLARDGLALLGSTDNDEVAQQALLLLETSGCTAHLDLDPDTFLELPAGDDDEGKIDTPTVESYKTAMVLMAASNGNAAQAASQAHLLIYTTGDADFYWTVIMALCEVFPWLPSVLAQNGIVRVAK